MSPDVVGALSRCSDPEAWQVLDRLLRAAGRQEGLRQSILEHTDLAHPGARELFIRTVVDEGYTRFASAIRAVGTWWGEEFEVRQDKQVREHLATWLPMLAEPPTDITSLTAPDAFLALQAHGQAGARLVLELLPGLPAKAQTLSTGLLGKRESTQGRSHVADALLRSAGPAV